MSDNISYPYRPALYTGIIFLVIAGGFAWIGELGWVIAVVCVAVAIGCIAAAYTTVAYNNKG